MPAHSHTIETSGNLNSMKTVDSQKIKKKEWFLLNRSRDWDLTPLLAHRQLLLGNYH
jgi:hypothetical protein